MRYIHKNFHLRQFKKDCCALLLMTRDGISFCHCAGSSSFREDRRAWQFAQSVIAPEVGPLGKEARRGNLSFELPELKSKERLPHFA